VAPGLALLLVLAALLPAGGARALPTGRQTLAPDTVISGGDLPHAVRLAPADEDALFRRLDAPPRLDAMPATAGIAYTVTSSYWDATLRGEDQDGPSVAAEAVYYPRGGYVRARQDGDDVWLVLDLRQRAILDRYIRLAAVLPEQPGVFDVLRAAVAAGEPIGVQVGAVPLDNSQTASFWDASRDIPLRRDLMQEPPAPLPASGPPTVWVTFTLAEGRSVQLLWVSVTGVLLDPYGEVYTVPRRWLEPVLGAAAVPGPDFNLAPSQIEQQQGRGSDLWWPILVGLGLVLLGAAWWLRRRSIVS